MDAFGTDISANSLFGQRPEWLSGKKSWKEMSLVTNANGEHCGFWDGP